MPPFASTAAATCTSACVSTPPVTERVVSTMVIAIPSASTVQGVARTSREGDRAEHAAANSELGHPPERGVPNSRPTPNAQARPERTSHQHHDGGPTRTSTHPSSLGNLRRYKAQSERV